MSQRNLLGGIARYSHLGVTLAGSVLLGFFGGYWLDKKIATAPLFTLLGTFIGATTGFIYLIKTLKQLQRDLEEEETGQKDVDDEDQS